MSLVVEGMDLTLSKRCIVKDVNLTIEAGEVVGLLGPNGAGKTTTFNMIVGLIKPRLGSIYLDRKSIIDFSMTERVCLGIGYLAQEPSVFRNLTVRENLEIALSHSGLPKSFRRKRCEELIEEFNLVSFLDRLGFQLSGGERRRCEVARSLAVGKCGPKYLLLDEPFAGVDPIAVNDLQKLIDCLKQRGIGILITDHNVRATLAITDRTYILNEGRIIASGTPEQVAQNLKVKENYLGTSFQI